MKYIIFSLLFTAAMTAEAKVDINYKMKLLDKNVTNAQSNFNKYKENLQISISNFNEATRIVNSLRGLKKQAVRDAKRSETNSLVFGQVMEKYTEFVAKEQSQILKEEEAVRKLEALVESVKQNTEQRRQLINAYNGEVEMARSEIEKWRQKKADVTAVMADIGEREKLALEERKNWEGKKETYKAEAKKWSAETKKARRTLATFEGLRK